MAPGSSIASRTRSKSGLQTNTLIHIENNTKREKSIEIKVNKVQENAIKKRKKPEPESSRKKPSVIDLSVYSAIEATFPSQTKAKTLAKGINEEEKRMRLFRHKAPQSYKQRLSRAISQRMFVISRIRGGTDEIPEEIVEMAGSTGNIYSIKIGLEPSCTCPDNRKGNQCKHIIYVLHNVLKAPENLEYQLAFISSELKTIFALAPPILSAVDPEIASSSSPSNRKEISGDCPICFTEFEPETENIVWCKAACGNNIHETCFEQWAKSTTRAGEVRCVFCRTPWQGDETSIAKIKASGKLNREGYVNVGEQVGLPRHRDSYSYHQPWLYRQRRGCF